MASMNVHLIYRRTRLNYEMTNSLNGITYFEIREIHDVFKYIMADLLLFVVVSDVSFDQKFNTYHLKLMKIQNKFSNDKYDAYETDQVNRCIKGKEYSKQNYLQN